MVVIVIGKRDELQSGICVLKISKNQDSVYVYEDLTVGFDTPQSDQISFFPNPSSGTSTLSLPSQEPTSIFIYNLQGKLMKELQSNTQEIRIELPEEPGVYLIKVVGESFSSVVKVVKE